VARRRNQRTLAQARRERAALFKEIAREHKRADRARLVALKEKLRQARAERRRAIAAARAGCRRRATFPMLKQLGRELREAKAQARATCDAELAKARAMRGLEARARAEHRAELEHQRAMRRIERGNAAKLKAAKRPGLAKIARSESDDEVRGNIPPELVYLFERVKRQIKGSDRMSRTEAFLKYAEEHPDEELAALEDRTDAMIREYEARMANPKKKKKGTSRAAPERWRGAARGRPRARAGRARGQVGDTSKGTTAKLRDALTRARARARELHAKLKAKKKNPRRPPARWWEACLASVSARRYARDPAAVCGATWWSKPAAERARIVRRLERGTARDRRFAVGIAKAEQRRHHTPRAAGKPSKGRSVRKKKNPAGTVPLYALSYVEQKEGDRKAHVYEHVFEGKRPRVRMRGGRLELVGGSQYTKDGWIHG
jgi:hypothetical protein